MPLTSAQKQARRRALLNQAATAAGWESWSAFGTAVIGDVVELPTMTQCIQVREDNGVYQIDPNAEVERWEDIYGNYETMQEESLVGWGEWTQVYSVWGDEPHERWTYFVAE